MTMRIHRYEGKSYWDWGIHKQEKNSINKARIEMRIQFRNMHKLDYGDKSNLPWKRITYLTCNFNSRVATYDSLPEACSKATSNNRVSSKNHYFLTNSPRNVRPFSSWSLQSI